MHIQKIDRKDDIFGSIMIPSSKSYINRCLILGSLVFEDLVIQNVSYSTDVISLINCLRKLGITIKTSEKKIIVRGKFPDCEDETPNILLFPGDGGTTVRFLLVLISLSSKKYLVDIASFKRPLDDLLQLLTKYGVTVETYNNLLFIKGPINIPSRIEVESNKSSQFASALQLVFPDKDITPVNLASSSNFLELTKYLVDRFKSGDRIFELPPDLSLAMYTIVLALLNGDVVIENTVNHDYLLNSKIISFLNSIGGQVAIEDGKLRAKTSKLKAFTLDCSNYLDFIPPLVFLASYIEGTSKFTNITNLKYKESDRVKELIKLLDIFKIEYHYEPDILTVTGGSRLNVEVDYNSPKDHRIIMAAYLFLRYNKGGNIFNARHVEKSFPNFFNIMKTI